MHETMTAAGWWLVHVGGACSLLMLAALVCMRWVRQPARRQRLGELAVAASVLVALVRLLPAWLVVSWPASVVEVPAEPPGFWVADEPIAQDVIADAAAPLPAVAAPATALPLALVLPILLGVYVLGAVFFLARWLAGWWLLRRLVREAEPAPDEVARLFARLWPRLPRLLMSSRLRVPASCGIVKPTILLPVGLCRPPDHARLPWVLAHEGTHLERRDAWSGLLFALAATLFFPLPWFWMLRRQVRLCQEYVADAVALEGTPADEYAEFLLSWLCAPAVPLGAAGVAGPSSDLFRRVTMLLKNPIRLERRCPRLWTAGLAGVLLAMAALLGGVGLAGPAQAQDRIIIIQVQPDAAKPGAAAGQADKVKVARKDAVKALEALGKGVILLRTDGDPKGKDVLEIELKIDADKDANIAELARRLALDLRGDLPNVKEIQELLNDKTPDKMAKFIDRLVVQAALAAQAGQPGQNAAELDRLRKMIQELQAKAKALEAEADAKRYAAEDKGAKVKVHIEKIDDKAKAEAAKAKADKITDIVGYHYHLSPHAALGVQLTKPSETLAEQLNLGKGQGLVVTDVKADSPAGKAGLKVNDILIKVGDKNVPNDVAALLKILESAKAAPDVVVLRKGKEETIKGLKLAPAAIEWRVLVDKSNSLWLDGALKLALPPTPPAAPNIVRLPPVVPPVPGLPGVPLAGLLGGPPGGPAVMTTSFRTGDRFTTRYQEGTLIINVTGKVAAGKATPDSIHVQDGQVSNQYDDVAKVPAQYRDKVNHLVQISSGTEIRLEKK